MTDRLEALKVEVMCLEDGRGGTWVTAEDYLDLSDRLAEAKAERDRYLRHLTAGAEQINESLARNAALIEEVNDLLPDYITMFRHFKEAGCKSRADYARAAETFYKRALATDAERDALARIRKEERERCAKVAESAHLRLSGRLDTVKDVRALIAAAIRGDDT